MDVAYSQLGGPTVRIFLICWFLQWRAIVLWQFGFAEKICHAHPILTTTVIAALCGIVVQLVLTYELPAKNVTPTNVEGLTQHPVGDVRFPFRSLAVSVRRD